MQFNSISDLYSKLSLKEVKRALQQTETKAKDASDKLLSLVATRYPDLLQVADMVDDMVETQTECMETIVLMQASCAKIPDFGISETRASIRKRQSQRLNIKQRQLQSSVKIQQKFRVFLAKKRVAEARLKKQELIALRKRHGIPVADCLFLCRVVIAGGAARRDVCREILFVSGEDFIAPLAVQQHRYFRLLRRFEYAPLGKLAGTVHG